MRLYLLLLALAIPASVSAQTTGTISGRVTDAATGAPLVSGGGESVWVEVFTATGDPIRNILVQASDGRYEVIVDPGTYYLRARGPSTHIAQLYSGQSCNAQSCRATNGTPVSVSAGSSLTIDFALVEGGRITGTARRAADGTTIGDIDINIYDASTSPVRTVRTDANGQYVATGLETGPHFLRTARGHGFLAPNYVDELYGGRPCPQLGFAGSLVPCLIVLGTPVSAQVGATTSGIDFSLDPGAAMTGTVTGPSGAPAPSGMAVVLLAGDTEITSTFTSQAGVYSFVGVPPGVYRARTRWVSGALNLVDQWAGGLCVGCEGTPAAITLPAGVTTTVDFTLTEGGAISGAYSCCGGAVYVYSASGQLVRSRDFGGASTPNSPGASYIVDGIPAGTYYVRFADPAQAGRTSPTLVHRGDGGDVLYPGIACAAEDCDVRRGAPVVVRHGETTGGIDFVLGTGGTISGVVPHFSLRPELFDSRGVKLRGRFAGPGIPVFGPGNNFSARGVPPGVYYLRLVPLPEAGGGAPIQYNGGLLCSDCPVTSGTPIHVESGVTATTTFAADSGQAIRGLVRDAADLQPLSTIVVEIVTRGGNVVGRGTTDSAGGFAVTGLAPGTYFARTTNLRGYVDEVFDDVACAACDVGRGAPIVVSPGADVSGILISLARGTIVTGDVTGVSAVPLGGTDVSIFNSGGATVARAEASVLGDYYSTVVSGTHFARSDPRAGYQQELFRDLPCASGTCDPTTGTPISATGAVTAGIDFTLAHCSAIAIAPLRLANAAAGVAYRQTLSATSGMTPVRFEVISGALPPGLTFDGSSGVLSGTPTAAGHYPLEIAAIDAAACSGSRAYTLDVPACVFNLPTEVVIGAAGTGPQGLQFGQSCSASWSVSSDVSWIHVSRATPGGTTEQVVVTIDPNPSSSPRRGTITVGSRVAAVIQSGTTNSPPFGFLETPANGAVVSGSVAVSGWALDDFSVTRVAIFRSAFAGEGTAQVFLGDATFVPGARPDVEGAFPTAPGNKRAGYGYLLLTNMLPNGGNGTFNLYAYAVDSHGVSVLLGERTVVVANSGATVPFGAIDTPEQGAVVRGAGYVNFGWALTPQPKLIPFDGSTISVIIDGVPAGTLSGYNFGRSDVSALFPGLKNSAGPVGFRVIDTTALSEGLHTIAWVVTDDAGQATGIGSRYFTVQNSAWTPSLKTSSRVVPLGLMRAEVAHADAATALPPRIDGVDIGRRTASLASLTVGEDGARVVALRMLQRLELSLPMSGQACASTYEGYLSANGELRALPVGSSLDRRGTFYWQPGPAFRGTYQLLFVRTSCDGARDRVPVTVSVQ